MKNRMPNFTCLKSIAITGLILILICPGLANAEKANLKFALWANPDSPHDVSIRKFAELTSEKTNGAMTIDVINAREAGIPRQKGLQIVKTGQMDGAVIPAPLIGRVFPKMATLSFPFLFFDEEHVDKTIFGEIGTNLLKEFSEVTKFKGLAFLENGFFDIGNTNQPIKNTIDLKGIKVRVFQPLNILSFATLGASPVSMGYSEALSAIQRGVVDTAEVMVYSGPMSDIDIKPYTEIIKYVSLTQHSYITSMMIFNLNRFNSIKARYKKILVQNAKYASNQNKILVREYKKQVIAKMKEAGVKIVIPNRLDIREALDKIFDNPPKEINKELLVLIKGACRWPPFCRGTITR